MNGIRCTCHGDVTVFPMPTEHRPFCLVAMTHTISDLSRRIDALESARRVDELQAAVKA